ncbi:MAG: mechanosensitive ion channel family protein [Deltaproteobacteria bacterium]|nr:mechanosensitive ion channel family protein [Deltaproteobacteria bacterium]
MPSGMDGLTGWLKGRAFLIENWQWIALLGLVLGCVITDRLITFLGSRALGKWHAARMTGKDEKVSMNKMARPFGLFSAGTLWLLLFPLVNIEGVFYQVLRFAGVVVVSLGGIWSSFKIIDIISDYFMTLAEKTENKLDDLIVPMVRRTLKVFIVGFGLVFIADNLNIDMASLLAGMGLGGLAFALAAKDMVSNLFGSITVLADRPFQIGDWINVNGIDGTVEDIGLRTTRLRTFYHSVVTVPNAQLTSSMVDNYGVRKYRRVKTMISVTYDTPPELIEAFCEGIRELIRKHPYTRKDYYHVYLNQFSASSLDILLYCFLETPEWATELRERHRLFLDIIRLAGRLGVEFAFPTQTVYLEKEKRESGESGHGGLSDPANALKLGKEQADRLVKSLLGDPVRKPPPVSFE